MRANANLSKRSRSNRETIMGGRAERKHRTDLGIAIAHAISTPGRKWTYDEIALFAGTTDGAIYLIEKMALRHIREKFAADPFLHETHSTLADLFRRSELITPRTDY